MKSKCLGFCVLKLELSGSPIALSFNGHKGTKSYKNEKFNILTPLSSQWTLLHIYFVQFLQIWNLDTFIFIQEAPKQTEIHKNKTINNLMHNYT